ncbi:hypothetical protein [Sanguibacter sp. HDW7]|uniref:hypothetical protein n=1 Tax=Sanguibacter sp. HDW7 TaxID=2714931 RepID=UPI00140D9F34|nr:hypothetical protein [Sanguibacter sp. HDW7]QIK84409.1 hypothetical protein G7063_12885 [Sanguibacter sp. HDW7]
MRPGDEIQWFRALGLPCALVSIVPDSSTVADCAGRDPRRLAGHLLIDGAPPDDVVAWTLRGVVLFLESAIVARTLSTRELSAHPAGCDDGAPAGDRLERAARLLRTHWQRALRHVVVGDQLSVSLRRMPQEIRVRLVPGTTKLMPSPTGYTVEMSDQAPPDDIASVVAGVIHGASPDGWGLPIES